MAVDFSFGQVEAICAAMNDITSDKRTAFVSRLKHLMKSGIVDEDRPGGEFRTGRGKAATFSFSQLMKMVIGVELLQAGTPPALAARLVQGNWLSFRVGVHFGLYNEVEKRERGEQREETYWVMAPEALRDLSSVGDSWFDHYEAVLPVYRAGDLVEHFNDHDLGGIRGHYRRQLILNGTAITKAAALLISTEMQIATIQDLRQDIYAEIESDQKLLDKVVGEIMASGEASEETNAKVAKMMPVFQAFDEQWETRVLSVLAKLSPSQRALISAPEGSEVEISADDLIALRKYDLFSIEKGELVITDLGQEVGAEVRRQEGSDEPVSDRFRRQLERGVDLAKQMAAAAAGKDSLEPRQATVMISNEKKRRPNDGDSN